MILDDIKTEFLAFACKFSEEDLNLLLNYLYLLLEEFRTDSSLLEVQSNKTDVTNTESLPLLQIIQKRSSQITEKPTRYELLSLENNIFMDVELAAVITDEANQATDAENTTVTTEAVSKPITTIVILDNDTSQEMEAETSSQTNIEKNPTAPVAVATETLDEQELETSIQKIEEDVCETINLSKLAEKTKAKKKTTKPTKSSSSKKSASLKRKQTSAKSVKYPTYVVSHLTKEYNENRYPTRKKIKEIALQTKLTVMQVSKWFTDRRSKLKHTKSNKIPSHAVNQFIKVYNKEKYPNADQIKQLEAETKVDYEQIFNWFRTRRHKYKQTEKRLPAKAGLPEHINNYLIERYTANKNPSRSDIEEIALQTHLTTEKVNSWFKKRRIQLKETKPNTIPEEAIKYLIEKYAVNKYPNSEQIRQMSVESNVGTEQIFNWFRTRRQRLKETKKTKYSTEVINYMIQKFNMNFYPSSFEFQQMSVETGLTVKQVNQWFSDRRFKFNHTVIKPIEISVNQTELPVVQVKEKKRRAPRQPNTSKSNGFPSVVVEYLNEKYSINNYPTASEIQTIVSDTGLTKRQINQWFNDKRYRSNKTRSNKYPDHVISYLIEKFSQNNYPTTEEKHKIALDTKLTTQQVNKWFEDRRYKLKKGESSLNQTS